METSPLKSAAEELIFLRAQLRETLEVFAAKLESEIMRVHEVVLAEAKKSRKPSRQTLADTRDMLSLLRMLEVKPKKGRRRDLKRFESVVEDLRQLVENW